MWRWNTAVGVDKQKMKERMKVVKHAYRYINTYIKIFAHQRLQNNKGEECRKQMFYK